MENKNTENIETTNNDLYKHLVNFQYLTENELYFLFDPSAPLNENIEWGKYRIVFHRGIGYRIYRKGKDLEDIPEDKRAEREKERKEIKKFESKVFNQITLSKPDRPGLYYRNRANKKDKDRTFKTDYQKFYSDNFSRFSHLPHRERPKAIALEWSKLKSQSTLPE